MCFAIQIVVCVCVKGTNEASGLLEHSKDSCVYTCHYTVVKKLMPRCAKNQGISCHFGKKLLFYLTRGLSNFFLKTRWSMISTMVKQVAAIWSCLKNFGVWRNSARSSVFKRPEYLCPSTKVSMSSISITSSSGNLFFFFSHN